VGTLASGAEADVTLLRVVAGAFPFSDSRGRLETGNQRIEAVSVVRAGRVLVWPCTAASPAPPASAPAR
jgi:predicted amidohydrolase